MVLMGGLDVPPSLPLDFPGAVCYNTVERKAIAMMTDDEFKIRTGIDPSALSEKTEPFSWFRVELSDGSNLWKVGKTSKKRVRSIDKSRHEKRRLARLAKYIERGYAFDERANQLTFGDVAGIIEGKGEEK